MPSPFRVDTVGPLTRVEVRRPFAAEALQVLTRMLQQRARQRGELRVLYVNPLPESSLTTHDVHYAMALVEARLVPTGLTALAVVASHPATYGVLRQFAAYGELLGTRAAAFHDEGEARRWLGVGGEITDPDEAREPAGAAVSDPSYAIALAGSSVGVAE